MEEKVMIERMQEVKDSEEDKQVEEEAILDEKIMNSD